MPEKFEQGPLWESLENVPFQPEAAAVLYREETRQLEGGAENLSEGSNRRRKYTLGVAGLTLITVLSGAMAQEAEAGGSFGRHHRGHRISTGRVMTAFGTGALVAGINDWRRNQEAQRRKADEDARAVRKIQEMLTREGIRAKQEDARSYREMQKQGLKHKQIMEKMGLQHEQKIKEKQFNARKKKSERADKNASEDQRHKLKQDDADKELKRKQNDREHAHIVNEWKAGGQQEREKDKAKFESDLKLDEKKVDQDMKRQEKGDDFSREQTKKMYDQKLKQLNELAGRLNVAKDQADRARIKQDYDTIKKELQELDQKLTGFRVM